MKFKDLEKELEADIRNKLTFPKTILEMISKQYKKIKKKDIEKAIKNIDEAIHLVEGIGLKNVSIFCSFRFVCLDFLRRKRCRSRIFRT